ncbi:MAG: DUF2141 domain-containing protein [Caulobacterales bacterium]|nr:DUF2141 domain-containing protein [Caulobacterales bacterium]
MKTFALAAALALLAGPALAQSAAPARIAMTFDVGAETGAVMVALYDSEAAYSGGRPARVAKVDVAAGDRAAIFDGLPPGDYGMKAFHDVDGDGTMDVNPFGMPTEPYAFSNNAVGNMGPAGWDRAKFTVSGDTAQTIRIR